MKKYLLTLFSVLVSVTLMGQNPFTIGSLTYTIISGTNNVKVKKADNASITNLVIPSTVENGSTTYTVTEIADNGFKYIHALQAVTIPNTVTKIGNNAFQGSGVHVNTDAGFVVNMGDNVTEIGDEAFQNCSKLKNITFPNTLTTIGSNAFNGCFPNSNIGTTLYFPPSLEKIEASAFQWL